MGARQGKSPHASSHLACCAAIDATITPNNSHLRALAHARLPWRQPAPEQAEWSTVTHFERRLARTFGDERVWLAGDAAHITSPFGGQSMNGGLSEVYDLVERMADCVLNGKPSTALEQLGAAREREWAKLLGFQVEFQSAADPRMAARACQPDHPCIAGLRPGLPTPDAAAGCSDSLTSSNGARPI